MPYTETTDVDGPLALYRTQSLTRSLKSYNCMEGLCEDPPPSRDASACADGLAAFLREPAAISEVRQLQRYLDELFCGDIVNESSINGASAGSSSSSSSCHTSLFPQRKEVIFKLIDKVDLSQAELNKYCFWDGEKPYTRNLVATDHVNYTLLLLCWNPGSESRVHNHPCDGCFVKTLVGSVKETLYAVSGVDIQQRGCRFYTEGQVSFMSGDAGLHRISNPNKSAGCISLHLYTPPFAKCDTWEAAGPGTYARPIESRMGFFSCYGYRTPHYEGRPGRHALLMHQIKTLRVATEVYMQDM